MKVNKLPYLITGSSFIDKRGEISFINDFNLINIKRFYIIEHFNKRTIRAWQGHKIEEKYFYVLNGSFIVNLVKIDDWNSPSKLIKPIQFNLDSKKHDILFIPKGFANGFVNLEPNSKLLIFSTATLQESNKDNFRFDKDYFNNCNW